MLYNSNQNGNSVFHIRRSPDGAEPIVAILPVTWSNREQVFSLMEAERITWLRVQAPDNTEYRFVYNADAQRPYPSVMILRVIPDGSDVRIVDVEQNDLQAVQFAWDNYL